MSDYVVDILAKLNKADAEASLRSLIAEGNNAKITPQIKINDMANVRKKIDEYSSIVSENLSKSLNISPSQADKYVNQWINQTDKAYKKQISENQKSFNQLVNQQISNLKNLRSLQSDLSKATAEKNTNTANTLEKQIKNLKKNIKTARKEIYSDKYVNERNSSNKWKDSLTSAGNRSILQTTNASIQDKAYKQAQSENQKSFNQLTQSQIKSFNERTKIQKELTKSNLSDKERFILNQRLESTNQKISNNYSKLQSDKYDSFRTDEWKNNLNETAALSQSGVRLEEARIANKVQQKITADEERAYKQYSSGYNGLLLSRTGSEYRRLLGYRDYYNNYNETTQRTYERIPRLYDAIQRTNARLEEYYTKQPSPNGKVITAEQAVKLSNNLGNLTEQFNNANAILKNEAGGTVDYYTRNRQANQALNWFSKNTKAEKQYGANYRELVEGIRNETSKETNAQYTSQLRSMQSEIARKGLTGNSFLTEIGQGFKKIGQFVYTQWGLQKGISAVSNAFSEINKVDDLITEISKTSDATDSELENLRKNSYTAASPFGQKAPAYLYAVQEANRAGYQGQQGINMAKTNLLAQTAGDINEQVSSEYLLATNAAFQYKGNTDKLMKVLDGQNQITNHFSVSMSDMAEATSKAASMAAEMGVKENELSAAIGVTQAGTQSGGSEVGNSLKSLFVNLHNSSSSKIVDTLEAANASMFEMKDGYEVLRSPMEILKDLSKTFNSLEDDDPLKSTILQNIGQKYHANKLAALLKGIGSGEYDEMLKSYEEGTGSAQREADKSANNITGSLNTLSNTFNNSIANATNAQGLINIIKFANSLLSVGNVATEHLGTLGTITAMGVGNYMYKNIVKPKVDEVSLFSTSQSNGNTNNNTNNRVNPTITSQVQRNTQNALNESENQIRNSISEGTDRGIRNNRRTNNSNNNDRRNIQNRVRSQTQANTEDIINNNGNPDTTNGQNNKVSLGQRIKSSLKDTVKSIGSTLVSSVVSTGVGMAVGFIVEKAADITDRVINHSKYTQEAASEAKEKVKTLQQEQKSRNELYQNKDLLKQYQTLSEGVDSNGNNKTLSVDEFAKFNDISNQIAAQFPSLISGYTATGNAILTCKDNMSQLNKAMKESYSDNVVKQSNEFKDIWEGYNDEFIDNRWHSLGTNTAKNEQLKAFEGFLNGSFDKEMVGTTSGEYFRTDNAAMLKALKEAGIDFDKYYKAYTGSQKGDAEAAATLAQYKSQATAYFKTLQAEQKQETTQLKEYIKATYASDLDVTDAVAVKQKEALDNIINNFDNNAIMDLGENAPAQLKSLYTRLKGGQGNSSNYLPIISNIQKQKEAMESGEMSVQSYLNSYNKLHNQLAKMGDLPKGTLEAFDKSFKRASDGITDYQQIIVDAGKKISSTFGDNSNIIADWSKFKDTLNVDDLKALGEIRFDDMGITRNIQSWNELIQKVREYKSAVTETNVHNKIGLNELTGQLGDIAENGDVNKDINTIFSNLLQAKELYQSNDVGTKEFKAITRWMTDGLDSVEAYQHAMAKLNKIVSYDKDGNVDTTKSAINFEKQLSKLKNADGSSYYDKKTQSFTITDNLDSVANKLGICKDAASGFFELLESKGEVVTIFESQKEGLNVIGDDYEKLTSLQKALNEETSKGNETDKEKVNIIKNEIDSTKKKIKTSSDLLGHLPTSSKEEKAQSIVDSHQESMNLAYGEYFKASRKYEDDKNDYYSTSGKKKLYYENDSAKAKALRQSFRDQMESTYGKYDNKTWNEALNAWNARVERELSKGVALDKAIENSIPAFVADCEKAGKQGADAINDNLNKIEIKADDAQLVEDLTKSAETYVENPDSLTRGKYLNNLNAYIKDNGLNNAEGIKKVQDAINKQLNADGKDYTIEISADVDVNGNYTINKKDNLSKKIQSDLEKQFKNGEGSSKFTIQLGNRNPIEIDLNNAEFQTNGKFDSTKLNQWIEDQLKANNLSEGDSPSIKITPKVDVDTNNIQVDASQVVEGLKPQIEQQLQSNSIDDIVVNVGGVEINLSKTQGGGIDYTALLSQIQTALQNNVNGSPVDITVTPKIHTASPETTTENTTGTVTETVTKKVEADTSPATSAIQSLNSMVNATVLKPKVTANTSSIPGAIQSAVSSKNYQAYATVFATVVTKGAGASWTGNAFVNGNTGFARANGSGIVGETKDNVALTGELGRELVVRGNHWFTVGENGAEFTSLKRNDIVFNHKQTEDLLKHGATNSRGRALAQGNARVAGTEAKLMNGGTVTVNNTTNNNTTNVTVNGDKSTSKKSNKTSDSKKKTTKKNYNYYNPYEAYLNTVKNTLSRFDTELDKQNDKFEDALERGNTAAANIILKQQEKSVAIYKKNFTDSYNDLKETLKKNYDDLIALRPELAGKDVIEIINDASIEQNIKKTYEDKLATMDDGDAKNTYNAQFSKVISLLSSLGTISDQIASMEKNMKTIWDENKLEKIENAIKEYDKGNKALLDDFAKRYKYDSTEDFRKDYESQNPELMGQFQKQEYVDPKLLDRKTQQYDSDQRDKEFTLEILSDDDSTIEEQINLLKELQENRHNKAQLYRDSDGNSYSEDADKIREAQKEWREYGKEISDLQKKSYENKQALLNNESAENEFLIDTLGEQNYDLKIKYINKDLGVLGQRLKNAKDRENELNESLKNGIVTQNDYREQMNDVNTEIQNIISKMVDYINTIKSIEIDKIQDKIDKIQDASDDITDNLQDQIDALQTQQDLLEDQKDDLEEIQDEWQKVASAVKKVLDDQKDILEDEKDSVSDYWDDRIKAIEKANEETDRNISLMEKQKALSESKEQKVALIYSNGKLDYQYDTKAVQDAEYSLAEEKRKISQDKAKEALEDQKDLAIKNIEDQIKAIEKYQEKWNEVFDWYENEIDEQAAYDKLGADWMNDTMSLKTSILNQVGNSYKSNQSIIEGSIDKEIKALEKQEKALNKQVDAQEKATKAQVKELNKQIKAIKATEDEFSNLYRQVVNCFETGNTTAIPGIIKTFVDKFNDLVGSINVDKLSATILQSFGINSTNSPTSTGNSTNTSSSSKLNFDEATKKAIEILNSKGLDGLDEASTTLVSNGYSFGSGKIYTADGTGRKFIRISEDGDTDRYLAQSSDGKWEFAYDYSTAASIAGGSSGNAGESSSNGSNNNSSSNINNSTNSNETSPLQQAKNALNAHNKNGLIVDEIYNDKSTAENALNPLVASDGKTRYFIYKSGSKYNVAYITSGDSMAHTTGERFAKGTDDAPRGLSVINDGNQYSGEIVNFRGGEQVIPADKSIKLIDGLNKLTKESIWDKISLEELGIRTSYALPTNINPNIKTKNITTNEDHSITISNINMYETDNIDDFVRELTRQLPLAAKRIKH